jgi:hypothetical protein
MTLAEAIEAIYAQLGAPAWAAPNLDGLADVLRDLSWRDAGPVLLTVPEIPEPAGSLLRAVLAQIADETADGPRPVVLVP